ncbi:TIGR00730 family Rossman fold protein [Nocardia sp. BSTN01]|uniref:LOG family protein n=1 Tax=Nocardia sp. BSTN01 TaxID=2783665 RepID=UPI00281535E6|nr:TIGR00730 family Rossman fold protein [Nocardia sp. BSTN01]
MFCGSSRGANPAYIDQAEALGRHLAAEDITLVYGGAKVGIMGALARAARAAGGKVVGVIPKHLAEVEIAAEDLSALHRVESMHERKALMAELADGFVALPGGLGTLEETAEIATWTQLGLQHKPVGLLNIHGFYDHLLAFLDRAVEEQFLHRAHRDLLLTDTDPATLLIRMHTWRPPTVSNGPNQLPAGSPTPSGERVTATRSPGRASER